MIETYQALYSIPARRRESIKEQAARLVAEDRAGCPHQAGRQIAAHFALPVPVLPVAPEVGTIESPAHCTENLLAAI